MIYALLVGIDEYPIGVPQLKGCLSDVFKFKEYLIETFGGEGTRIRCLLNAGATREGLVSSFRDHLGLAQSGDTALFYFSGHGSRLKTAKEFVDAKLQPEGLDETLVCYDSRTPGAWDLADKELVVLIAEIASPGVHCVVVLDCCHATGMTRDPEGRLKRRLEPASRKVRWRPLATYMEGHYQSQIKEGALRIPVPRHLVFAACDRDEVALEGEEGGLFSRALLKVLTQLGPKPSLGNLLYSVRNEVSRELMGHSMMQTPRMEFVGGFRREGSLFSSSFVQAGKEGSLFRAGRAKWVNWGAMRGLDSGKCAYFQLFDQFGQRIGLARVLKIDPVGSLLDIPYGLVDKAAYASPQDEFQGLVQIAVSMPGNWFSDLSDGLAATLRRTRNRSSEFFVKRKNGSGVIVRKGDGKIVACFPLSDRKALLEKILKALLRWRSGIVMQGSRIPLDRVEFAAAFPGLPDFVAERPEAVSVVLQQGQPKRILIQARNRSSTLLYFTLLYFSENYGIYAFPPEVAPPNGGFQVLYGNDPDHFLFLSPGAKRTYDRLRLLITTKYPDSQMISQAPLGEIVGRGETRSLNMPHALESKYHGMGDWGLKDLNISVSGWEE